MNRFFLHGPSWRGYSAAPLVSATLLGAAYAFHDGHRFRWIPCLLCAAAAFASHRGAAALMTLLDPSGDTGPEASSPDRRRWEAVAGIAAAFVLGLGVSLVTGPGVFLSGALGMGLAIALASPPVPLAYLGSGIGEGLVGLLAGPVPVVAAHLGQGGALHAGVLIVSLPAGLLAVGIVLSAQRDRVREDASEGRLTLAVILGEGAARWAGHAAFACAHLAIVAGVLLEELPRSTLVGLSTLPAIAWAAERAPRLTAALAAVTIGLVAVALLARRI